MSVAFSAVVASYNFQTLLNASSASNFERSWISFHPQSCDFRITLSVQTLEFWPVIPGCDRQSFADLSGFIWLSLRTRERAGPRRQPGKRSGA